MTAGQQGTFEIITRHFVLAVEPLHRAVADLDSFRALLRRLGWDVTSLPQPYLDLATVVGDAVDAAESLATDPDPGEVAELLAAFTRVYQAVDVLDEAPAGIDPADIPVFLGELAERLLELLLTDYLAAALPTAYRALSMIGVIDAEYHEGVLSRPAYLRTRLNYAELPKLFTDPGSLPARIYGWGTPQFPFVQLRDDVYELLWALGLSASIEPVEPQLATGWLVDLAQSSKAIETRVRLGLFEFVVDEAFFTIGLSLTELPAEGALLPGVIVQPDVPHQVGAEIALTDHWTLRVRAGTDLVGLFGVLIRPGSVTVRYPLAPGTPLPSAGFGVTLRYDSGEGAPPTVLLGRPEASRLELKGASAGLGIDLAGGVLDVAAGLELDGLAAVISGAELDGFLGTLFGGSTVVVPITLGLTWSTVTGFRFTGEAGFEITLAQCLTLGPISVDRLLLALRSGASADGVPQVTALVGFGLSGALGPVSFAVDGLGVSLDVRFVAGNAGPLDLRVGLQPPSGLGLSIKAGPVAGGGFIGYDDAIGRYSGVFAVQIGPVSVSAIGMLDTRLPGQDRGFALLIFLAARFPGIALGFGIVLTGVGGLVRINGRCDTDALRQRFVGGAVGRILAPEDPIRNAPSLLAELDAIFPRTAGVYVLGPTVQLTWAALVTFDLGIFIELPGPSKIVLLGSARAALENPSGGRPYLQLRLDIIGVLDFDKKVLEFDAALFDSQLLEVFELTGGAAFRLSWGEQPYVVLSIGGFHPAYNPAPMAFPSSLTRVAMTRGSPTDLLYLRFEGYFAITTNTVQFGAAVQVIVNAGPFRAEGFLGFDALIRFQPFFFQFSFQARVRVSLGPLTLAAVRIDGVLSGPGPITFSGELCIQILFFEIRWRATITIGSSTPPAVQPVTSALPILGAELRRPDNLFTEADDPLVSLAPPENATLPVMAPTGPVVWAQKRAPLGLLLQRFEGAPLERHETITAGGSRVTDKALDWFAPGNSVELSNSDAINRRAFERLPGGVKLGSPGDAVSGTVTHPVAMEQYRLGVPPRAAAPGPTPDWLQAALNRRDGVELPPAPPPAITVEDESWTVSTVDGELLAAGLPESQAHQLATANGAVAGPAGDRVVVVSF